MHRLLVLAALVSACSSGAERQPLEAEPQPPSVSEPKFPAEYRGNALLAFRGSWNRDVPTGAKVVRVRVQDGRPVSYEDLVAGWQLANGTRWGRPVGVAVAADGSVLVSDDAGGAIFRVYR